MQPGPIPTVEVRMADNGPTQGAERHQAKLDRWDAHPWMARLLRWSIVLLPLAVSLLFTLAMGRYFPAERLGLNRWVWVGVVFIGANLLLIVLSRLTRKLLPLVALMRLTLVFPDHAPSRSRAVLRKSNSRTMLRELQEAAARGDAAPAVSHADYLVQLLQDINEHDRLTRGHSERVRAYAELLGEELDLSESDMDKLRWSALLHDAGKLDVPAEVLNKDGRPTDDEWKLLQNHPAAARAYLEPLRPWLGEWIHSADQHHCRWDGKGYPEKTAGTDISLPGRLVAIADAFDVMTSARSYKKPLSPEIARQELTDCAGSQFDPTLVRAFLRVGLADLKVVAGPLAWIANLIGSARLPAPALSTTASSVWTSAAATLGVAASLVGVPVETEAEPPSAAREVPAVTTTVAALTVPSTPTTTIPSPTTAPPTTTTIVTVPSVVATPPTTVAPSTTVPSTTIPVATTAPPATTTTTVAPNNAPVVVGDVATTLEDGSILLDVLANDADVDGDTLVLAGVSEPGHGSAAIEAGQIRYTPWPDYAGADAFTYLVSDMQGAVVSSDVSVTVDGLNDAPTIVAPGGAIDEDASIGQLVLTAAVADVEDDPLFVAITSGDPFGVFSVSNAGEVRLAGTIDHETVDEYTLGLTVSDGAETASATVTVDVVDVNESPTAFDDALSTPEDAPAPVDIGFNDTDPEGQTLTWDVPALSVNGAALAEFNGLVTYTPVDDSFGTDSFTYTATDSQGLVSNTATVSVTVTPQNDPPAAADDAGTGFGLAEDAVGFQTGVVTANDVDIDSSLDLTSVVLVSNPSDGVASYAGGGRFNYTPDPNYSGADSFTYTVEDAEGAVSNTATVTLAIGAVNDPPSAFSDAGAAFEVDEDDVGFVTGDVTTNDVDIDDGVDATSAVVSSGAANGSVSANGDGTFTYTPDGNYSGSDSFTYTVDDVTGATSNAATVSLVVAPSNDAPTAADDSLTVAHGAAGTTIDVRLNDDDVDGDSLTVTAVSVATNGTVVDNGNGTITYTHGGSATASDSFTYTVEDPSGEPATATVNVTVTPPDDGDGVAAGVDVCPYNFDPMQIDTDNDGIGDVCDPFPTVVSGASFADAGQALGGSDKSFGLAVGDIDGDGDLDAIYGNHSGGNTVFTNDGSGNFSDSGQSLDTNDTDAVELADIDGDGDLDAIFLNKGAGDTVWRNNGSGVFTDTGQSLGNNDGTGAAVADFDLDGDLDFVTANLDAANRLWLNNGSGTFTMSTQNLGAGKGTGVAAGDLDGDGDLDVVFANEDQNNTVWLNNGSAVFTDTGVPLGANKSHDVALADFDGDGDLDVVFAEDGDLDRVWLNDGAGSFADTLQLLGIGHSHGVSTGDIDGDGDIDILLSDHTNGNTNTLYLNDGSGTFAFQGQTLGMTKSEHGLLVDVDGDGDLDLMAANDGEPNEVWLNS